MTYPSQNFYPCLDAGTPSHRGLIAQGLAQCIAGLRSAVENLAADFTYWRDVHATSHQLAQLDDAMLRDIGLHRSQIASTARRIAQAKRAGQRQGRRTPSR